MKRILDLLLSIVILICFLPFGLIISAVLICTGERKVFFLQPRVGKGGKIIDLIKFATMLKDSPNIGPGDITVGNDPRVLPFGRFLRKTKLNEIPQILNVIKGDLSLVGPRPLTPKNFAYYSPIVQDEIKTMKPGLTGVGSIIFRDEELIIKTSKKSFIECYKEDICPYKGELELWYKKNQSFLLDIKLIVLTALVVLLPNGDFYKKFLRDLPGR